MTFELIWTYSSAPRGLLTNVEAADPDDLQAVWCCVGVAAPTTGNPAQGKVQAKMEVHQKIRDIFFWVGGWGSP